MNLSLYTASLRSLRHSICKSCLRQRIQPRSIGVQNGDREQRRRRSNIAKAGTQAVPLEGFYAELLSQPLGRAQPATHTASTPPPREELPKTDREEVLQKARIVFGSRLAGPAERREELRKASVNIAGIIVPPRPTEPDNCCMSGCVNCVWDLYRDEMEEWAAKSAEARQKLQAQREQEGGRGGDAAMPSHVATSMDDDGGGSETNWNVGLELSGKEGDLFADIPVGIREFMRTEKLLKERRAHQGLSTT